MKGCQHERDQLATDVLRALRALESINCRSPKLATVESHGKEA